MAIYHGSDGIPAFFEQITLPPGTSTWPGFQNGQQPRGMFDFMCDPEFPSPESGLFNFDAVSDLDLMLGFGPSPITSNTTSGMSVEDQNTKQRVAAFRRSLWYVRFTDFNFILAHSSAGFGFPKRIKMHSARKVGFHLRKETWRMET